MKDFSCLFFVLTIQSMTIDTHYLILYSRLLYFEEQTLSGGQQLYRCFFCTGTSKCNIIALATKHKGKSVTSHETLEHTLTIYIPHASRGLYRHLKLPLPEHRRLPFQTLISLHLVSEDKSI